MEVIEPFNAFFTVKSTRDRMVIHLVFSIVKAKLNSRIKFFEKKLDPRMIYLVQVLMILKLGFELGNMC